MRQLPLQIAAMMLALVFLVSCDRKPQTPLPPAWSFDPWASVTLPKPSGLNPPLPRLRVLRESIAYTQYFNWDSDKDRLLAALPAIHDMMDAAPTFAPINNLTINAQGDWIIGGFTSDPKGGFLNDPAYERAFPEAKPETQGGFMIDLGNIILTLLEHHEDLTDPKVRERAQGFALALINMGSEIRGTPAPPDRAALIHYTGVALISKGYQILGMLDKVDRGNRLSKPFDAIDAELLTASRLEAKRLGMLRDAVESN